MKRLRGFTKLTWEREPLPGLRCSLWLNGSGQYAYLYQNDGDRRVAKTPEEQAEIHELYGLPAVRGDFATGARVMFLKEAGA